MVKTKKLEKNGAASIFNFSSSIQVTYRVVNAHKNFKGVVRRVDCGDVEGEIVRMLYPVDKEITCLTPAKWER